MPMLNYVDPDEVVIDGRIRKDCGNLDELAEDIRENGLINPPTVYYDLEDEKYHLIAGERRLRACKEISSMRKIPVLVITDPIGEERKLRMEISENEVRQGFSMSERVDYARRLTRIEAAKAAKRMVDAHANVAPPKSAELGETRDKVAAAVGFGRDKLKKAQEIVDHKADIDPEDFAAWDDGKLSTNKVYQDLKAKLAETTDKLDDTNHMLEIYIQRAMGEAEKADKARKRLSEVETENIALKNREPEVITKVIAPDDYGELKDKLEETARSEQIMAAERQRYLEELRDARKRIEEMESRGDEAAAQAKMEREVEFFKAYTTDFVQRMGGYVWIADKADDLPEDARKAFKQAVLNVRGWTEAMLRNWGGDLDGQCDG